MLRQPLSGFTASDVGIERIDPGQQAPHFADVDDTGKTRFPQPLLQDRGTDRAFVHNDDFGRRLGAPRSLRITLEIPIARRKLAQGLVITRNLE